MATKLKTRRRTNPHVVDYLDLMRSGRIDKGEGNKFSLYQPGFQRQWNGKQVTVSEGHRKRNKRYVEGGPFQTASTFIDVPTINARLDTRLNKSYGSNFNLTYYGPIHVPVNVPLDGLGITIPAPNWNDLDALGAEAVSLVHPGNPNAELGVALGELARDGLPIPGIQAWKHRTELAKAAGSEYLNAVFGWLPMLDEMSDIMQSITQGNMILENYHNSSGTFVHREFQFPIIESESETVLFPKSSANSGISTTAFHLPDSERGPLTRTTKTYIRRKFSGAFGYHADKGSTPVARMLGYGSDANKLFGTSLTPEVMWELTPWSWAVDWFSNAGNVITNLSNELLSGSVMRYGYIMEEKIIRDIYTLDRAGLAGYNGPVPPVTVTYKTLKRREANPFGFGLSWDNLSPSQLLIAAALGITRLR